MIRFALLIGGLIVALHFVAEYRERQVVAAALAEYKATPTSVSVDHLPTGWIVYCNDGPATSAYGFTLNGDRDRSKDWSASY